MTELQKQAIKLYRNLPFLDSLHLRIRLANCPFDALLEQLPEKGIIGDVGCGHGLLCALTALQKPNCKIIGVDPDKHKIGTAQKCLADISNIELRVGTLNDLPASLDAIIICDVLYLIPFEQWPEVLISVQNRLRPGGRLILKEAGTEPAWKYKKTLLEEWLMVNILQRTYQSGGLHFQPKNKIKKLLEDLEFRVELAENISHGYSTPHILFTATKT